MTTNEGLAERHKDLAFWSEMSPIRESRGRRTLLIVKLAQHFTDDLTHALESLEIILRFVISSLLRLEVLPH